MNRLLCLILAAIGALSSGCTETPVSAPLRSLEGSQDVSFVCLGPGGVGRELRECPDFDGLGDHLFALVTQEKGEVAVIDHQEGIVVDADPSTPGFTFLHIGGDPRDIVSTPGGAATFVGVAEVNREGIFALPSTCIGPPKAGQSGRDLTTWPACSLPSAPGSMAILIDPPDSGGSERDRCPGMEALTSREGALTAGGECPADLTTEPGPIGRRKLAVALPELGRIDIFDAQAILNRDPGSFDPCDRDLEARVPLRVDLPTKAVPQRLPPDLQAPGCVPSEISHGPRTGPFIPQPSGFALGADALYVGDRQAPVIHVLDVGDPCAVSESPLPLLPVSYNDPNRLVTTTEVALSDPTSSGQQFLYALDVNDPDGSSAMVFNVTPGETDRVPLVRPGTDRLPEPPDRIRFSGTVITSLAFGSRDLTVVDEEGRAANPLCNPDPALPPLDPGAIYRPKADRSAGAAPGKLRGIFAFAALKSGEVMVIDVEDYDAPCRRPTEANSSSIEDFRGCKNDPAVPDGMFVSDGTPTVTDEVSCRVVQPHLARSASFVLTDENGVRAPSLRSLPRFTVPGEANPDRSAFPKVLATEYPAASRTETVRAEVYVGTEKFSTGGTEADANRIVIDPTEAEENSLILPWVEPRSYAPTNEQTLVYEGTFSHRSGPGVTGQITRDGRFLDRNNAFCGSGVQDVARAREWGAELGLTRDQDLDRFAQEHADVVQITANIPAREDTYWQGPDGAACVGGEAYFGCLNLFGQGAPDAPVLKPCPTALGLEERRELIVREAYQSELVVEPKNADSRQLVTDNLSCCFPSFVSYRIRAAKQWVLTDGGVRLRHDITAQRQQNSDKLRCVKDCRPQRRWQKGRAIEIPVGSWSPDEDQCDPSTGSCPACVPRPMGPKGAVLPVDEDQRAKCIFESLGARFVVYEGSAPSVRDMCFSWVANGGFTPLAARLTTQTLSVSPVNMTFVPEIGQLAVVDGSAAGLVFVSLDTIGVSRLFF
jgi:hypothetical protein